MFVVYWHRVLYVQIKMRLALSYKVRVCGIFKMSTHAFTLTLDCGLFLLFKIEKKKTYHKINNKINMNVN